VPTIPGSKVRKLGLAFAAMGAIMVARSAMRRQVPASGSFSGSADSWPPVMQAPVKPDLVKPDLVKPDLVNPAQGVDPSTD
jgi:hypothetical protein